MFAHYCYLQVILLLTYTSLIISSNVEKNKTVNKEESIFSDVIRNISRVNNVLQDLIQNYEHIQKIYDTKSFEEDYSTDIEIDEVFKVPLKNKQRTNDDTTTFSPNKYFPGTAMIISEENDSEIIDSNSAEDNDGEKKVANEEKFKTTERVTDVKRVEVANTNKESYEDASSGKDPNRKKDKERNKRVQEKSTDKKQFEVFLISTTQSSVDTAINKNMKSPTLKNKSRVKKRNKQKRRKTKSTFKPNKPESIKSTSKSTMQNLKRNVQKVIYSESFPTGKIWDEIANKKPINLRAHMPLADFKVRRFHFRGKKSPQTALVIVTKNKNDKPSKDLEYIFSSDSEEQDQTISKQLFKANVLRHAYGEACLKLVVKKCYKACKETSKIVCRMFKCKTSFKEKFLNSAKTGCLKEFRPQSVKKKSDVRNNQSYYMKIKNYVGSDLNFFDATRQGFPAEACYPFMKSFVSNEVMNENLTTAKTNTDYDKEINILRDSYERACQRASSAKCRAACLYGYNETCDTYQCQKGKKKAFKKHCRKQCKNVYKYKTRSKDSSLSSSSSSSSSSDSEFDSDFS